MVFNTSNIGNDIHCEKIWGFTIGLAIGFSDYNEHFQFMVFIWSWVLMDKL
jgi:hypothetical protein